MRVLPERHGARVVRDQPLVVAVEVVSRAIDRWVDPRVGHRLRHTRIGPGGAAVIGTRQVGVDEEIAGIVAAVEIADVDLP